MNKRKPYFWEDGGGEGGNAELEFWQVRDSKEIDRERGNKDSRGRA